MRGHTLVQSVTPRDDRFSIVPESVVGRTLASAPHTRRPARRNNGGHFFHVPDIVVNASSPPSKIREIDASRYASRVAPDVPRRHTSHQWLRYAFTLVPLNLKISHTLFTLLKFSTVPFHFW